MDEYVHILQPVSKFPGNVSTDTLGNELNLWPLRSVWGRFGVDLGSTWGRLGVGLGSVWVRFGISLGSVWGRFGGGLGSIWGRFGYRGRNTNQNIFVP